jgi:hypothetical protein
MPITVSSGVISATASIPGYIQITDGGKNFRINH